MFSTLELSHAMEQALPVHARAAHLRGASPGLLTCVERVSAFLLRLAGGCI
jgi:hypothetical protein